MYKGTVEGYGLKDRCIDISVLQGIDNQSRNTYIPIVEMLEGT